MTYWPQQLVPLAPDLLAPPVLPMLDHNQSKRAALIQWVRYYIVNQLKVNIPESIKEESENLDHHWTPLYRTPLYWTPLYWTPLYSPIFPPTSNKNCSPMAAEFLIFSSGEGVALTSRQELENLFRITSSFRRDLRCNFCTMSPAVTPSAMSTAMQTRVKRGAFTRIMWWSDCMCEGVCEGVCVIELAVKELTAETAKIHVHVNIKWTMCTSLLHR